MYGDGGRRNGNPDRSNTGTAAAAAAKDCSCRSSERLVAVIVTGWDVGCVWREWALCTTRQAQNIGKKTERISRTHAHYSH